MSAKHTPGPWTAQPGENFITDARDIVLAQMHRHRPDEQVNANVRLMAAAPELLGVLMAFCDYVRNEQMSTDGAVIYSTTAINHWAFLARAAIAKATEATC